MRAAYPAVQSVSLAMIAVSATKRGLADQRAQAVDQVGRREA